MQSQPEDRVIAYEALVWIIGIILLSPAVVGLVLTGSALGSDGSKQTQDEQVTSSVVSDNPNTTKTTVTKSLVNEPPSFVEVAITAALDTSNPETAPTAAPAPDETPQTTPESGKDFDPEPAQKELENTKPSTSESPSTSPPTTAPAGPTTTEPEEPERRPFPRFPDLFPSG